MIRVMGLPSFGTQPGHYDHYPMGNEWFLVRVIDFEEQLTEYGPMWYTVLATEGDEEFDDDRRRTDGVVRRGE